MEISQKTAEEEERYKKEMEKYTTRFVHKVPIQYRFEQLIYEISYMSCFDVLCRIEAAERKHNREWQEDWGSKDRPKSPKSPRTPKSPSPAPPELKKASTSKAKSSRKDT